MIVSNDENERRKAIMKLLPYQKKDFYGILKAMAPHPVTIRLLDPPLHEFLPQEQDQMQRLAKDLDISADELQSRIENLHEQNPMLGHRGCRLGISYPEITEMQAQAIFEASAQLEKENESPFPEVMVPLVGSLTEFVHQRKIIDSVAKRVKEESGTQFKYLVGTMIELPRACTIANQIAEEAQFFSFGTNDLTQTTYGFSRDDIGGFLPDYLERKILPHDPFQSIDKDGVGALVKMGIEKGRAVNPKLKIGICGEHGGDPKSIIFFHETGLDYVSCSTFRVPIARLAAAQAEIQS
jgi:pyruvate,orthophosphate dikinase